MGGDGYRDHQLHLVYCLSRNWDSDTHVYIPENREIVLEFVKESSYWQQGWTDTCDGQMGRNPWVSLEGSGHFVGSMDVCVLTETRYETGRFGFGRMEDMAALVRLQRIDARLPEYCRRVGTPQRVWPVLLQYQLIYLLRSQEE